MDWWVVIHDLELAGKRRTSSATPVTAQDNFWSTVSAYSCELAHVAGPLLEGGVATGDGLEIVVSDQRYGLTRID